uniref:P/Homo B domain-containing protein n=1 Tax=Gasterosteus aculeatus aculeatus TaxID=481459 RepID=A0AAQ4PL92_GASAC
MMLQTLNGSMFSAALLVVGCLLLQRNPVTTEGHRGTNRHVFYALRVDGGPAAARALAEQHGLEFILRVGSLQDVYTLRDSRGRRDRAAFESTLSTAEGVHQVTRQHSHYRDKRVPVEGLDFKFTHSFQRGESASDRQPEENKSDQSLTFNDPLWPMQWELLAQGEYSFSGFDLNVMPVWKNTITGDGVVVSIVDDGIDHTNKDLKKNFEALASFDVRASHGLSHDPMPLRDEENSHGTRCAGEVAMEANNSYCGVGIAFNARIGGIRLLDGPVTDAMEATSLTYNMAFIDIYVCSWGPQDDGATVDGPLSLTARALRLGTHEVTVTNMDDGCVTYFPGTSSAAPIAAGILALALEVNPALTWRDVQHLIANTAKIPDPKEPGWNINAAGHHVHHRYGFGLLDAGLMVQQAAHFSTVMPQRKCMQGGPLTPTRTLSPGGLVTVDFQSAACLGTTDDINTLEHVQVSVSIDAVCRGDLSISLESPAGTVSLLLDTRPNDASAAGLKNWTLMTVHCWGEHPRGLWSLKVTDHKGTAMSCSRPSDEQASGAVLSATLILYGTYRPRRAAHDGPLQSIVSMGLRHPVPHREAHRPLELIQWVYQMERDRKVRAADISVPARHKMWKVPGDLGLDNPALNKLLTSSPAFQEGLHQSKKSVGLILLNDSSRRRIRRKKTTSLKERQSNLKRYIRQTPSTESRPSAVTTELHGTNTIRRDVDRENGSLPSQNLQDVVSSPTLQIREEEKL